MSKSVAIAFTVFVLISLIACIIYLALSPDSPSPLYAFPIIIVLIRIIIFVFYEKSLLLRTGGK